MAINLAPGTQYIIEARKRRQRLYITSFAIVLITLTAWGAVYWISQTRQSQLGDVLASIRGVDTEIAKSQSSADEIRSFEQRLEDLDVLLNGHVSWEIMFSEIERLLPPDTVITGINTTAKSGVIGIEGTAPDVDKIALTLASIKDSPNRSTIFSNATFSGSQRIETAIEGSADKSVTYKVSAELTFDPSVLLVNK